MSELLVIGQAILAQGPFVETADAIQSADAIYPKHVISGYEIVEAELPDDFTCAGYEWINDALSEIIPASNLPTLKAAAIAKTYIDVDAVYQDAIGNRVSEYSEAEAVALAYQAAGYTGDVSEFISAFALSNPTGIEQTNEWAANAIIAQAEAMRTAQLAMRTTRFDKQKLMREATTEAELTTAVSEWNSFITATRTALGL
tara:strand:+ start:11211 stop:11813 length:603 start_codon:yes stop_codon:yes gene_type:complete